MKAEKILLGISLVASALLIYSMADPDALEKLREFLQ